MSPDSFGGLQIYYTITLFLLDTVLSPHRLFPSIFKVWSFKSCNIERNDDIYKMDYTTGDSLKQHQSPQFSYSALYFSLIVTRQIIILSCRNSAAD